MSDANMKASALAAALPYIRRYRGANFVIKYGGHAMESAELREGFARDVVMLHALGIRPVVVHGGGPQINQMIERLGLKSSFVRGMRVTDVATMEAVEMVLLRINKEIATLISGCGGRGVGLCGKDDELLIARRMELTAAGEDGKPVKIDLGLVGEIAEVNPRVIRVLVDAGFIPVIAPIGYDRDGRTYNINADVAAGDIAGALNAEKFFLLTDVEGVRDRDGNLITTLNAAEAKRLIHSGDISAGMIPKVECCLAALAAGAGETRIIDGRVPHSILLEIFTQSGAGTQVING